MSIEITLYPDRVTRESLRSLLRSRGYTTCKHLWTWPKRSAHFEWFEGADFKSIDGVEATVYPPAQGESPLSAGCAWALHTRTRASASTFDRREQNDLIRAARQQFGGSFYNDWHGKNRYTPIPEEPKTAAGRGIFLSYEYVTRQVKMVEMTLPEPWGGTPDGRPLPEPYAQYEPTRVLLNALVPFAVAALEHFFGQTFRILVRYDLQAQDRLCTQTRKVEVQQLLAVSQGLQTVEDVVASWYSFQNLSSIHAAFSDWLGIDFWGILRARRRLGRRVAFLDEHLQRLIDYRHGVVHRFELDSETDRETLTGLLETVPAIIDVFVDHLEGVRGVKVRD